MGEEREGGANKKTYIHIYCRRQEVGNEVVHLNITMRHPSINGERVETRRNLRRREFDALKLQSDPTRGTIKKKRRCFLFKERYYQIDVYEEPSRNAGLVMLEAYLDYDGTLDSESQQQQHAPKKRSGKKSLATAAATLNSLSSLLPPWLKVKDVTNDPFYSMYNLALN